MENTDPMSFLHSNIFKIIYIYTYIYDYTSPPYIHLVSIKYTSRFLNLQLKNNCIQTNKDTHEAMNEMSLWPHISDAYNNTGMTI